MDTATATSAREQLRKEIELSDPAKADLPGRKSYLTGFRAALQYISELYDRSTTYEAAIRTLGEQYNIEMAVQFFRKETCVYSNGFLKGLRAGLFILEEAC